MKPQVDRYFDYYSTRATYRAKAELAVAWIFHGLSRPFRILPRAPGKIALQITETSVLFKTAARSEYFEMPLNMVRSTPPF
jgi:hypothetical protein